MVEAALLGALWWQPSLGILCLLQLSDFGLCHQLCKGNVSQMTETMGTLAYMSPEHIQGRISKACDSESGAQACPPCCANARHPQRRLLPLSPLRAATSAGSVCPLASFTLLRCACDCVCTCVPVVWSMGMVLWQMTTGQAPFSKLTQPQVIMGVMNGSLRPQWPTVDVMPELVDVSVTWQWHGRKPAPLL